MLQFNEHYKIIKKLGQGSFASVYLVNHRETCKQLAIKAILKEKILAENKGIESFFNETNLMKQLNHESILKLYEIWENQHSFFYVIELSNLGSLKDRINQVHKQKKKNQKRDILLNDEIKSFMYQLINGLIYLKEKKIMHRDIKPDNILIRKISNSKDPKQNQNQLQVFFIDFGLATSLNVKEFLFYKCGTPGYVAPEILNMSSEQKTKYGLQCDVFSLGAIFYQMLTLQQLFHSDKPKGILKQNIECNIDFNDPNIVKIDSLALDLLRRMLDKNPDTRISPSDALQHKYFEFYNSINQFEDDFYVPDDDQPFQIDVQLKKFNQQQLKIFNVSKINFLNKEKLFEHSFKDDSFNDSIVHNINLNIYAQSSKLQVSQIDYNDSSQDLITQKSRIDQQISNCSLVIKAPQNQAGSTYLYLQNDTESQLSGDIRQKTTSQLTFAENKINMKNSSLFKQDFERQRACSQQANLKGKQRDEESHEEIKFFKSKTEYKKQNNDSNN